MSRNAVDNRTQLQKDIDSNAGVIPIFPWIKNGMAKDDKRIGTYANELQIGKQGRGQPGDIIHCESSYSIMGCPFGSCYWLGQGTSRSIVPNGWTNYGGMSQFTLCSLCRAIERENGDIEQEQADELELGRVDHPIDDGSTGNTASLNNKKERDPEISTVFLNKRKRKRQPTLMEEANILFKGKIPDERLEALKDEIQRERRKTIASAAEKRRKSGGRKKTKGRKRRKKKRTRKKRRK